MRRSYLKKEDRLAQNETEFNLPSCVYCGNDKTVSNHHCREVKEQLFNRHCAQKS